MSEQDIRVSSLKDIRQFVFTELARMQDSTVSELERQMQEQGGDLEIDSMEGMSVAHGLGGRLNRDLVKAEDLVPKNFNSVEKLTKYLHEASQRPQEKKRRRS